jgi:exodeoxyribonuclease V alpha subunit
LTDTNELNTLILQGAKAITDSPLYTKIHPGQQPATPICQDGNRYYLQRYWTLETECLDYLQLHFLNKEITPSKNIPFPPIEKKITDMLDEGKLLPEQAQAISKASQSLLTLITGGPGTGKTYTAGILLRTLWEMIPPEERSDFKIALAAPTGKAAANLEASIRRALVSAEGFTPPSAQTLHQLLKINKNNKRRVSVALTADLILIDESSMIDMNLMSQLLQAIKPGARLVLLGDRHQLPSVEAGAIFADFISCFESHPHERVALATLNTCLRAELKGIIDLATCVNEGKEIESLTLLDQSLNGIRRLNNEEPLKGKLQQKRLLAHVLPHFPIVTRLPEDPWSVLEQFSRFRILTPMRKGILGVESLNSAIQQAMQKKMCSVFPIIVMQNDHRLGLFNGEVGLLVKEGSVEFALFASRDTRQAVRRIPRLLMPRFEYAYCLSIHKSQGSEFDHVVLLLPEGSQCFGREALYTGITRAKKQLDIWSPDATLQHMIRSVSRRQSGVAERQH